MPAPISCAAMSPSSSSSLTSTSASSPSLLLGLENGHIYGLDTQKGKAHALVCCSAVFVCCCYLFIYLLLRVCLCCSSLCYPCISIFVCSSILLSLLFFVFVSVLHQMTVPPFLYVRLWPCLLHTQHHHLVYHHLFLWVLPVVSCFCLIHGLLLRTSAAANSIFFFLGCCCFASTDRVSLAPVLDLAMHQNTFAVCSLARCVCCVYTKKNNSNNDDDDDDGSSCFHTCCTVRFLSFLFRLFPFLSFCFWILLWLLILSICAFQLFLSVLSVLSSLYFRLSCFSLVSSNEAPSSSFATSVTLDPVIRIFDFPSFRPISSFPFTAGAWSLCFFPQFSSTLAIISSSGLLEMVDALSGIPSPSSYSLPIKDAVTCMTVSRSGDMLCIGDAAGCIHLWATSTAHVNHDSYALPEVGAVGRRATTNASYW